MSTSEENQQPLDNDLLEKYAEIQKEALVTFYTAQLMFEFERTTNRGQLITNVNTLLAAASASSGKIDLADLDPELTTKINATRRFQTAKAKA